MLVWDVWSHESLAWCVWDEREGVSASVDVCSWSGVSSARMVA